jgi:hypothetical protein
MKKSLLFLLMCVGLILSANAGINVKKTVNVLDPVLTLEEEDALIQSEDQITYNAIYVGDGSGVSALIDFDTSTWFHSPYGESEGGLYPNAKHWLQFDLKSNNNEVVFHFSGRQNNSTTYNDCPNDFVLLGTNTPEDESSWVEVQAYKDLFPSMANSTVCFYTGIVDLKGYQHIRMVVNNTTSGRTESTYGQHFFTLSQLNFYPVKYQTDKYTLLTILVDSITTVDPVFIAGTEIGQVPAELVNAWQDAYLAALEAPDNLSDAEYDELATNMLNALQACKDGVIRLPGGLYFVVNGNPDFETTQGVKKAWYATADKLRWKNYDQTELSEIFKLTLLESGNYSIQTVVEDFAATSYVGYQTASSTDIPMVGSTDGEMCIEALDEGKFFIHSNKYASGYHPESHGGGAGVSGDIVAWGGNSEPNDWWYLEPCSEEQLEAAIQKHNQSKYDAELKTLVDSAQFVYNKCFTYGYNKEDSLIFTKDQLMSNAIQGDNNGPVMSDTQGLGALIDGPKTWFHSAYSSAYHPGVYHNLQVKFLTPQQKVVMFMRARDTNSNHDTPNDVIIYATNDDAAGTDAFSSNDSWTKVTELVMDVENESGVEYVSSGIDLGAEYKYFRMVVIHTTDEAAGRVNSDGIPYYNLSQFQLYPFDISKDASQYYYVEGMKEAADNVLAMAEAKAQIVANKATTQKDIDEMRAAIKAVTDLVGDPKPFTNLLAKANALAETAVVDEDAVGAIVSDEALNEYKAAIEAAVAKAQLDKPAKVNIEAATIDLQNAIDGKFYANMNKFETNKWYYLKSAATVWADGAAHIFINYPAGTSMRYGGDQGGAFAEVGNTAFMWRLEDNGNGTYTLRNRATGTVPFVPEDPSKYYYANASRDSLQNWSIVYGGYGAYYIEAHYADNAIVRNIGLYNDRSAKETDSEWGDLAMPSTYFADNRSLFIFEPVTEDAATFEATDNYMRVWTLPYELPGGEIAISAINEGVKTYAIHSIGEVTDGENATETITKVNLVEKDGFEAGEPFIIMTGDPSTYDSENVTYRKIMTAMPETFAEIVAGVPQAKTVNGLVGTFPSLPIEKAGYGYISGGKGKVTTGAKITLGRQNGYIDPTQVTPVEGDIDAVIEFVGTKGEGHNGALDGVKSVKVTINAKDGSKKVYTLDGKYIGEDLKNLSKGIYIVGKKKVAVK